jgi:hypothetical protein
MPRCALLPYVQYGGGVAPCLAKKSINFIVSRHLRDTALACVETASAPPGPVALGTQFDQGQSGLAELAWSAPKSAKPDFMNGVIDGIQGWDRCIRGQPTTW